VFVSMPGPDIHPADLPVDRLSAVCEWLWRHSSQPNGDPWDHDPEHLIQTAQDLLNDLAQRLIDTDPPTISSTKRTNKVNPPIPLQLAGGR
jgi:hypothetical protein